MMDDDRENRKPGGPRANILQNPVVLDILHNLVARDGLKNPVVNGLFAKPGGPRPTDCTPLVPLLVATTVRVRVR